MKTHNTNVNSIPRQSGQGMTEYIIIVALIAIAAIGVSQLFGETVQNQIAGMAAELGGADGTEAVNQATARGEQAVSDAAAELHNLSNYQDSANVE